MDAPKEVRPICPPPIRPDDSVVSSHGQLMHRVCYERATDRRGK